MSLRESQALPLGGPILTRPFRALLVLAAAGAAVLAWRFAAGLGATTGLNDGYPWGLWIAFDVVIGTALGCGGYAVAILVYLLNRGRYHPLVRPAVLTSALGYSMAGVAVVVDVGRYWNLYKVPLIWRWWNLNSVLLEVALCIMAYAVVLWIELLPALLERWRDDERPTLRRLAQATAPRLDKALVWILALGMLLPTMHQSSLGSLLIVAGRRLHPLWQTTMLPLLFLLSCIAMGYAVVVVESGLASLLFRRPRETAMLGSLAIAMVPVLALFLALRLGDLAVRGRLGEISSSGGYGLLFTVELLLFAVPIVGLSRAAWRRDLGHLFRMAMLIVLAGALYRFDVYLVAFDPGPGWSYFPTVPELLVSLGIVAAEVMAYLAIVKRFPILAGRPAAPAPAPVG